MSGAHSYVRANEYNLTAVRELLLAAFTESDLRRFCLDDPRFRFVCNHFGEQFSHYKLVDTLIRQCLRAGLLPELLSAIEKENPRQFERFAERLFGPSEPGTLDALFPSPFQAPPLPAHFVPRPEVSEAVKAVLLAGGEAPGVLVVGAIQGLGGIGKSVLAAALAHDPQMRASFPDGVLWATLGQESETLSLLAGWLREGLGDYDYQPLCLEDASLHLRTLLQDKACLLVIDDVWDPAAARPFLAGGTQCRALVTTRRADVADALAAGLFSLDLMTDEQSLALLGAWLGRSLVAEERAEALRVAHAVGNLPLALELAAARVARGVAWGELCAALEAEVARLEALESARDRRGQPRLEAALRLSLDALQAEDPGAWQAFAWLGVLPEDLTVAAPAAATLWSATAAEADDLLELLWSDALLLPGASVSVDGRSWRGYRLHDLLRAMARRLLEAAPPNGLGLTLPQAHAVLLDRYRAQTHDGLWHTLDDDGYIYVHLTWHMEMAGQVNQVHALLREETPDGRNGWYDACERLGRVSEYLGSVARAWQLADSALLNSSPDSDLGKHIGLQTRYVLITASINSLARNIPSALLVALVEKGVWTAAHGLAYIRQLSDEGNRSRSLIALAPHLPSSLFDDALEIARHMKSHYCCAQALAPLSSYLPSEQRELVLSESFASARRITWKSEQAQVFAKLLPYLHPRQREQALKCALDALEHIEDDHCRTDAFAVLLPYLSAERFSSVIEHCFPEDACTRMLVSIAPRLSLDLMEDALAVAKRMQNKANRNSVLSALVSHLTPDQSQSIVHEINLSDLSTYALASLVSHLPPSLLGNVLAAACQMEYRDTILVALAPRLPDNLLARARDAACSISNPHERFYALAALLPRMPVSQQEEILAEIVSIARQNQSERYRALMLRIIAINLPPQQALPYLSDALLTIQSIQDDHERVAELTELISHLPSNLLEGAWAVARQIDDPSACAAVWAGLAPYLPAGLMDEALTSVCQIQQGYYRAQALAALAPYLPSGLVKGAWEATLRIPDGLHFSLALAALTPYLSPDMMTQALAATQGIKGYQKQCLEALAPYLPVNMLPDALACARQIGDVSNRADAVGALVPYLKPSLLLNALAATRWLNDIVQCADVIAELITYLPSDLLAEALVVLWGIERANKLNENYHFPPTYSRMLTRIADRLPPPLIDEVLSTVRKVEWEACRTEGLAALAPRLPSWQCSVILSEALANSRSTKRLDVRARMLAALAPYLYPIARKQALAEILDAAQESEDDTKRVSVIRALAPHLDGELLNKAVDVAREIGLQENRAQALVCLAPFLSPRALEEALVTAGQMEDQGSRALLLAGLARYLPPDQREPILAEALASTPRIGNTYLRFRALADMSSCLSGDLLIDALSTARQIDSTDSQVQSLAALIPRLPADKQEPILVEALISARNIADSGSRSRALSALIPCLVTMPVGTVRTFWCETLHDLSNRERQPLFSDLCSLASLINQMGRDAAILETFRAIQDVSRWWP